MLLKKRFIYLYFDVPLQRRIQDFRKHIHSRHLLVQSQQQKHQNNVLSLFNVNNKDNRTTSLTSYSDFLLSLPFKVGLQNNCSENLEMLPEKKKHFYGRPLINNAVSFQVCSKGLLCKCFIGKFADIFTPENL